MVMEARPSSAFTLAKKSVCCERRAVRELRSELAFGHRPAPLADAAAPSARARVLMSELVSLADAEPLPAVVAAAGALASTTFLVLEAVLTDKNFVLPPDGAAACALLLTPFGEAVRMTMADPTTMVATANATAKLNWLILSADGTRGVLVGRLLLVNGKPRDATAMVYWRVAAHGGRLLLPLLRQAVSELGVYECAYFLHFEHQPLRAPILLRDGAPIEITRLYPGFEDAGLKKGNGGDERKKGPPVVCEVHLEGRKPIVLARRHGAVLAARAADVKRLSQWAGTLRTRAGSVTELLNNDILCVAPSPNSNGDGGYHLPVQGDRGWMALLRLRRHAYVVGESVCACCTGSARVAIASAAPEAAASSSAGGPSTAAAVELTAGGASSWRWPSSRRRRARRRAAPRAPRAGGRDGR